MWLLKKVIYGVVESTIKSRCLPAFSMEKEKGQKIMLNFIIIHSEMVVALIGVLFAFAVTICATVGLQNKLPADQGREFAHDGSLSKGKPRGAGIIFVLVFALTMLLFAKLSIELIIYLALIVLAMLTGFLDDAAKTPWGEYKKGLLDFIIAALIAVTYLHFNGNEVTLALFHISFVIPKVLFVILAIILVWVSINVTNCTDGVDGLSATLSIITLATIYMIMGCLKVTDNNAYMIPVFIACLLGYLWFNATPSKLLMGDAGSRAMGLLISIVILKTGSPFLYIPAALVLIVDGGIGLIKVSLKRFLKISILKNTTTPLHDHVRKRMDWSNTHVVFRFAIIQIMISVTIIYLLQI